MTTMQAFEDHVICDGCGKKVMDGEPFTRSGNRFLCPPCLYVARKKEGLPYRLRTVQSEVNAIVKDHLEGITPLPEHLVSAMVGLDVAIGDFLLGD